MSNATVIPSSPQLKPKASEQAKSATRNQPRNASPSGPNTQSTDVPNNTQLSNEHHDPSLQRSLKYQEEGNANESGTHCSSSKDQIIAQYRPKLAKYEKEHPGEQNTAESPDIDRASANHPKSLTFKGSGEFIFASLENISPEFLKGEFLKGCSNDCFGDLVSDPSTDHTESKPRPHVPYIPSIGERSYSSNNTMKRPASTRDPLRSKPSYKRAFPTDRDYERTPLTAMSPYSSQGYRTCDGIQIYDDPALKSRHRHGLYNNTYFPNKPNILRALAPLPPNYSYQGEFADGGGTSRQETSRNSFPDSFLTPFYPPTIRRPPTPEVIEKPSAMTLEELSNGTIKSMRLRVEMYNSANGRLSEKGRNVEMPIKRGLKVKFRLKFAALTCDLYGVPQDMHFIVSEVSYPRSQ